MRAHAADLLAEWRSPEAVDALVGALTDRAAAVRIHAARGLGRSGDPAAVGALVRALGHRDDALAGAAVDALLQLGPAAVPALVEACRSDDEWVRWHAARALGHIHDSRGVPVLVELLGDLDTAVRWAAAQGVHRQGPRALEAAVESLTTRKVTPHLADGAGHLVRHVREPHLAAVLRPLGEHLRDSYAAVSVPPLAEQVLPELRRALTTSEAPAAV